MQNRNLATRQRLADAESALSSLKAACQADLASGGRLSQEAKARLTAATAELEAARLARDEYEAQIRRELDPSTPAVRIGGDPFDGGSFEVAPRRATGAKYRELFPATQMSADGWRNSAEFVSAIHAGLADPRLRSGVLDSGRQPRIGATAGTYSDPDGGFLVPTAYAARWLDSSLPDEIVRPRATAWPMSASVVKIPGWDEAGSDILGGWTAEAQEITPTQPTMRQFALRADKLAILSEVSIELLQDGIGYEQQLDRRFITQIGRHFDRAFLRGTGVGEPLGVLNAGCTIEVDPEEGQGSDSIIYANITKMFARMLPRSVPRAVWLANPTTIPQLLQLSLPVGTGGSVVNVLNQSNGEFRMLTRPVIFTDLLPALGDAGDLVFADLSAYSYGMRQGVTLDRSAHVGFTRGTVYFRALLRAAGAPGLDAPYEPDTGDSLSPFVILGAR